MTAPNTPAEPVAWRYDVDGQVWLETRQLDNYWRDSAGEWVKGQPLYASPQPAAQQPKPLDDPRLQELFMSAITGAMAFGYQGNNRPPAGHWLNAAWGIGRAEAENFAAMLEKARRSSGAAQQPAAVPDDERQAFENWYEGYCMPGEADWFRRDPDEPDEYKHSHTSEAWAGWKARAAAPQAPSPDCGQSLVDFQG